MLSPPASSDSGGYVQPVNEESFLTVSGSNLPVSKTKCSVIIIKSVDASVKCQQFILWQLSHSELNMNE